MEVPPARDCTLRAEWQCHPHGTARSGPSGSAAHTATRRRAYQNGTLGPEWQCERYARARVAVPLTLPLGGERTGQRHPHCHSTSNVPKRYAQGRVAVRVRVTHGLVGAAPMLGRALSEPRRKDWTIRRAATPARDSPPASREIAGPRPGDGGAPFPMRTGRPARAIPRLPPAAAPQADGWVGVASRAQGPGYARRLPRARTGVKHGRM